MRFGHENEFDVPLDVSQMNYIRDLHELWVIQTVTQ